MTNPSNSTLYIDTSFGLLMAVQTPEGHIRSKTDSSGFRSEAIDALYRALNLPSDFGRAFERCVVGIGPGSFTGLRTGIAYAQGLCIAPRTPMYTVSSFEGLWPVENASKAIMSLIPAKKDHFYIRTNVSGLPGHPTPQLMHQDALIKLAGKIQTLVIAGPEKYRIPFESHFSQILNALEVYNFRKAIQTALLGKPVRHGVIKPDYVQLPAAELNRLKQKHK